MDGAFVPNISYGAPVVKGIRPLTEQIFDIHLMIEEPIRYLEDFKNAGADLLCVHSEACRHLDRTITAVHELGCLAGVALNPSTPLDAIKWVLDKVDMVLLMSVNPGFGGQAFIPEVLPKLKELSIMLEERGLADKVDVEVDGGIRLDNVVSVIEAGANVIVAGSAIFGGEASKNVEEFKNIMAGY